MFKSGEGAGAPGQVQATENVTKTQSTTLKTYGLKVIFVHFSYIYQHSEITRCKILCVIFLVFFTKFSLESSRVQALRSIVNAWDHTSRITSQYLEQFGWCTCATEE